MPNLGPWDFGYRQVAKLQELAQQVDDDALRQELDNAIDDMREACLGVYDWLDVEDCLAEDADLFCYSSQSSVSFAKALPRHAQMEVIQDVARTLRCMEKGEDDYESLSDALDQCVMAYAIRHERTER